MTLTHSAEPRSARRALAAIGIATLAVSLWTIFVRSVSVESPVSLEGLERFGFEPYLFGLAAQELAVPLVLLFLVSRLSLFRRVVVDQASARDEWFLALLLVSVQILFFLYRWNRFAAAEESVTWGYFVVFAAALMGGWRTGLLAVCRRERLS